MPNHQIKYQPTHFDKLPTNGILKKREELDPYVFSEDIVIAVDVALATDRPMLIYGKPGSGKSRLAEAVAAVQEWNFLGKTMTSRTRLEELTVEIDYLRRLNDARSRGPGSGLKPDEAYHNPGIFWWAFNPVSACFRGMTRDKANTHGVEPLDFNSVGVRYGENEFDNVVLLIDEIDKAEPDLPNDLLEPLDTRSFGLPVGGKIEETHNIKILTVITTNGERELPQAFLRRCVTLELPEPLKEDLIRIAIQHFPEGNMLRIEAIAEKVVRFRKEAENLRQRPPGTSEFLDAIQACEDLDIDVDGENSIWKKIENAVLVKKSQS